MFFQVRPHICSSISRAVCEVSTEVEFVLLMNRENQSIYFTVPHLLSCMIPIEDSDAQILPDKSWTDTESDRLLLVQHNERMSLVLADFSQLVAEFRLDVKSNAIKLEKDELSSRKRNFEKI
jgi:hypothetical protein